MQQKKSTPTNNEIPLTGDQLLTARLENMIAADIKKIEKIDYAILEQVREFDERSMIPLGLSIIPLCVISTALIALGLLGVEEYHPAIIYASIPAIVIQAAGLVHSFYTAIQDVNELYFRLVQIMQEHPDFSSEVFPGIATLNNPSDAFDILIKIHENFIAAYKPYFCERQMSIKL